MILAFICHDAIYICSFWDWVQGVKIGYIFNENSKSTRITSMDFINPHDDTLLMCGSGELGGG